MKDYCALILLACGVIAPLIVLFSVFDALLRYQYEHAPSAWRLDGSPRGYFWSPPDLSGWQGAFRRSFVLQAWLSRTPQWAMGSPDCIRRFFWLRVSFAVWVVTAPSALLLIYTVCV